jgi:predicted O-methyltransferase YrrM
MYSPSRLAVKYLRYYFSASNGRGHGIHSPFVYDFVRRVLQDKKRYTDYSRIGDLRRRLKKDGTILEIEDLGAGSAIGAGKRRSISELAGHAAKPARLGQLLFRIARYYQPGVLLELGTSLGLSTAYLAAGSINGRVWTIEGSAAIAAQAGKNFQSLEMGNVEQIVGDFDQTLHPALDRIGRPELVFVDGNHRREPTLRYFGLLAGTMSSSSVLIFDDIHWSEEMEQAWDAIRADPRVMLTVDLFFIGLVFFREEFKIKQHFTIRF